METTDIDTHEEMASDDLDIDPVSEDVDIDPISEPVDDDAPTEKPPTPPRKTVEKPKNPKSLNLPLARIKQIIKMDPEVTIVSQDAVFLITKATELFISTLGKDSYNYTAASKKKTIQIRDVNSAVANTDALIFLDGAMDF